LSSLREEEEAERPDTADAAEPTKASEAEERALESEHREATEPPPPSQRIQWEWEDPLYKMQPSYLEYSMRPQHKWESGGKHVPINDAVKKALSSAKFTPLPPPQLTGITHRNWKEAEHQARSRRLAPETIAEGSADAQGGVAGNSSARHPASSATAEKALSETEPDPEKENEPAVVQKKFKEPDPGKANVYNRTDRDCPQQ